MEFKKYTVEELVKLGMLEKPMDGNHGGKHPTSKEYAPKGIPFIMVSDINNGKINYNTCKFITKDVRDGLDKGFARPGDVLLSHKATIGMTTIVGDEFEEIVLTPQLTYYRVKSGINNEYLKYYFDSEYFQSTLKSWSTSGSTRAYLGITAQLKLPILLPDLNIQNKIAKLLSDIDKKIELNNQINDNLYEMGKTYYNYYFKNYKFTNKLKRTELGEIPTEYEVKFLSDETINNREKVKNDLDYKVLSAVKTGTLQLSEEYFTKSVPSSQLNKYIKVEKDDFAYNPARINIGSIGRNEYDFKTCVSPVYVAFSIDKIYKYFWDFYFKDKIFNNEVNTRASGSVRQTLKYEDFGLIKIAYPSKRTIEEFNSLYAKIDENIKQRKDENIILGKIRDILLPKLMNGEIDLDKIEI